MDSETEKPDISVITVTYNSASTLEKTILSVLAQENVSLEYIIIDGASTDDTKAIIEKYSSRISYWVSERDQGIYDAMNKGLMIAKGKWIAILNSDDFYTSNHSLHEICKLPDEIAAAACNVIISSAEGQKLFRIDHARKRYVNIPYMHTGIFIRNSVYQGSLGYFDLRYQIASDIDLVFRAMKAGIEFYEIDEPLVVMSDGGISSKRFFRARREYAIAYLRHYGSITLALVGLAFSSLEFFLYHTPWIRAAVRKLKQL